ncbi:UNVERIFIED_CONTAM: putative alpha-mannosidase, partial [Sesamum angustifolium]
IKTLKETSLSANQDKSEMTRKAWKVDKGETNSEPAPIRGRPVDFSSLIVELGPMEIRTFIITY